MPYHFGIFSTKTPEEWKNVEPPERMRRALDIVADTDSELVGMWFDRDEDTGYVLLAGPNDSERAQDTLEKLGCDKGRKVLLTPAEKRSGR